MFVRCECHLKPPEFSVNIHLGRTAYRQHSIIRRITNFSPRMCLAMIKQRDGLHQLQQELTMYGLGNPHLLPRMPWNRNREHHRSGLIFVLGPTPKAILAGPPGMIEIENIRLSSQATVRHMRIQVRIVLQHKLRSRRATQCDNERNTDCSACSGVFAITPTPVSGRSQIDSMRNELVTSQ